MEVVTQHKQAIKSCYPPRQEYKRPWPTGDIYSDDTHHPNGKFKETLTVTHNNVIWSVEVPGVDVEHITVYGYGENIFISIDGEEVTYLKASEAVELTLAELNLGVLTLTFERPNKVVIIDVDSF